MLLHEAPHPARGRVADGFEPVARVFAEQIERGDEVGASFSVYLRGQPVVDLWGGMADSASQRPWQRDTRIVVFSVTKGLAAMAMHMLADRGVFDWDEPVADHWRAFAKAGKGDISVRTLMNHRGGLAFLDAPLTMADCVEPGAADKVREALETQAPNWAPGTDQGYHAITFGLYLGELFQRLAGESMGSFLQRELFDVVDSDARLGTPASLDDMQAELYPPGAGHRIARMAGLAVVEPNAPEARIARSVLRRESVARKAFANPSAGRRGILAYNEVRVRRAELAWASATASADGIARAYLPFAAAGRFEGRQLLRAETIEPVYPRQSWSHADRTLNKPLGWSQGFLKEQRHLFCPNPESFGHAGMGGSLGWCDPVEDLALGYVMNRMDWRVRSPRCLALCRAVYDCEPLCGPGAASRR
jgi:CubicO group peptidase (beta-lactamase class C family)